MLSATWVTPAQPVIFFKESTSTLVDIAFQGVQGPEVIRVVTGVK